MGVLALSWLYLVDRVEMPGQASMCTEIDPSLLFRDGFED